MDNNILTIDYKDWLLNQKRLPDKSSEEANDFFEFHKKLCLEGCYVDGVYFNPFLYWHLNLWNTEVDVCDDKGYISQKYKHPTFRDNEWLTTNAIWEANRQRKGLAIGGIRRFSKSVQEASYIAWGATFDENSQNIIAGLNGPDIKLITDKLDKGLNFLPWYYKWDRIEDNWKNQVTLGIKSKSGERYPYSSILIRNLDDGANEEAIAGTKPRKLIIDEGGKGNFLRGLQAAIPGFTTQFGWGCSPIVTFTGGDMKKFFDAKQLMFDVEAFNFLEFQNEKDSRRIHGLFIGHKYRLEAKVDSSFGDFINATEGSQLYNIHMQISDGSLAEKITNENLERTKKSGDRSAYLKEKMYYPKEVDDIFLNEDTNIFDIDAAKAQQTRLKVGDITGSTVELFHDGETIKMKNVDKRPITNYPIKPNENKDAPIVIWEAPIANAPYGLYVAGCLLPGEKVSTEKGIMNVEDISLQNKLINVEGKEVDIYNLQRYLKKDEDIYTIKLSNCSRTTSFTKEHPIFVSDSYYSYFDGKNKSLDEGKFVFDFQEVKNIKINQWVKSPNRFIEENNFDLNILWNNYGYRIDRQIKSPLYNSDFWWFIGLFLGDGWTESNGYKITIACNRKETQIIDRLNRIIRDIFHREPLHRIKNNCVEVSFSLQQLSIFLSSHFKKYANEKLIPVWVKKISIENKQQILQGYLDSDGCVTIDKKRKLYGLDFVSINLTLLEDIQDIFFSLGFVSNITILRNESVHNICGKTSKTKKTYHLRLGHDHTIKFKNSVNNVLCFKLQKIKNENIIEKRNRDRRGCFISDDNKYIYFQIKNVIKSKYSGWVYNFECDTHTYMCGNIPTHNCDPYRQGKAVYSDSLGAVYIYKRMHDIFNEKFQDMFVASYVARPDDKEKWNEQARLLCKFYNARIMCENDEYSFIDYIVSKGDAHLLEKQPVWIREITPNTTQSRDYGLSRASEKIRDFLHTNMKKYLNEIIHVEKDEQGSIIKEIKGVHRMRDVMLLEEIIQYNEDGNFDRIIAAELAITCAMKMDPLYGRVQSREKTITDAIYVNKKGGSRLFPETKQQHFKSRQNIKKLLG